MDKPSGTYRVFLAETLHSAQAGGDVACCEQDIRPGEPMIVSYDGTAWHAEHAEFEGFPLYDPYCLLTGETNS